MKTYKIISAPNPEELESYVNDLIVLGWEPIGGVTAIKIIENPSDGIVFEYSQALVKEK